MKRIEAWVLFVLAELLPLAASAGTITYYHNDLLGSPVAATDASGHVVWRESYRPYGERLTNDPASTGNDVWYTSRRQDADTGLVYMGARYYDPVVGRFVSKDPVGFDEKNILSFNRYAYANDNPYRFVDPNGRFSLPLALIGATALAVGAEIYLSDPGRRAALEQGIRQGANNFQNNLGAARDKLEGWIFNDQTEGQDTKADAQGPKNPPNPRDFEDPNSLPDGWGWRGKGEPGSREGAYHNPETGESLHDDRSHAPPKPGHWTYTDPQGNRWDNFGDGWIPQDGK